MFKLKKSKQIQENESGLAAGIEETLDKLAYILTEKCFNKETCTRKNTKHNEGCLMFCKRIQNLN